jgi:hypothetical protein
MFGRALFWRVLISVAASCLVNTHARAEEPATAALHFVRLPGTEDCVDGRTLAQRVERELGRQVFTSPATAGIFIEAAASRNEVGYAVVLRIFDAQGKALGTREVRSDKGECAELGDTVALVLAVMVDPEAVLSALSGAEKTPEPAAATVPAAPPLRIEVESKDPRVRPPVAEAALFSRGAWGFLPELGLGFGVAVSALTLPHVTLRVEGTGYLDQKARLSASEGGTRLRLLLGGLFACPLVRESGRLVFSGCGGLEAGAMQSQGFGLDPTEKDQTDGLVNAAARLGARLRIAGPLFVNLGANLSVPLVRTLYQATRADGSTAELFEASAVAIALDLGLAARF